MAAGQIEQHICKVFLETGEKGKGLIVKPTWMCAVVWGVFPKLELVVICVVLVPATPERSDVIAVLVPATPGRGEVDAGAWD